ncbi:hypothetical protein [Streptomyces coeruleorubidus]|uniref:hypothetical protein n=1 Tax=Streptomyces coeruleorubidus TaxID=116188 RepID=UPI0036880CA1
MSTTTRELLALGLRRHLGLSRVASGHYDAPDPGAGSGGSTVDTAAHYLYDILRLDDLTPSHEDGGTTFPTRKRSVSRRD